MTVLSPFSTRLWHELFFQSIDVRQYALLRIGLGALITVYWIDYFTLFQDHFGPQSWLGALGELDLYHSGSWSILFLCTTPAEAWSFFGVSLLGALCFTLGFFTRISGFLTWIGLISIWNRNPLVLDGDDAILRIMLFYLLLAPCGNALSLDARGRALPSHCEIWPLRMMQIQLALVYFVSGWVKFHSPEWLDGTVLQTVLIHPEYSRWNWNSFMNQPFFLFTLAALTYGIMTWELLFPILIASKITRRATIEIGLMFHIGLLAFMHLRLFSIVMLVLYVAWLPSGFFERWSKPIHH